MRKFSFLIMGDAHLDADFPENNEQRRREQRLAFDKAMSLVSDYAIDYLLVPGDLFDKRNPDRETFSYVMNSFAALEKTKVIIAPGNHDPMTVDSPYRSCEMPGNVYVFPEKRVSFIEFSGRVAPGGRDYLFGSENTSSSYSVRFYGSAFEGHFSRDSMLVSADGKTPRLSGNFINVLVMHGKLVEDDEKSIYNPIPGKVLEACGFDFCAIGSEHSYLRRKNVFNSGILCPRGFLETGDTGVIAGEVTEDNRVRADFIPINAIRYEKMKYDITGLFDLSPDRIADGIKAITDSRDCYLVELTGETGFDESVDAEEVKKRLTGFFPIVDVVDKTVKKADIRLLADEKNFRGAFCSVIWDSVRRRNSAGGASSKKNDDLKKYSEKTHEDAINLCLKLFDSADTADGDAAGSELPVDELPVNEPPAGGLPSGELPNGIGDGADVHEGAPEPEGTAASEDAAALSGSDITDNTDNSKLSLGGPDAADTAADRADEAPPAPSRGGN